jgi:methylmalonyl-CoA mutase
VSESLHLASEFPPSTRDQWRAGVDKVLAKGKRDLSEAELEERFNRELVTPLLERILVEPLYTGDDADAVGGAAMPGFAPFRRGASALGGSKTGWDIRQALDVASSAAATNSIALEQLELGATSLFLRATNASKESEPPVAAAFLNQIFDGIFLDLVTVSLDASLGTDASEALLSLYDDRGIDPSAASAVLGLDPIGALASLPDTVDLDAERDVATTLALRVARDYPNVRTLVVDATRYHDAGCSHTEELACAIATGIEYVRMLTDAGLTVDDACAQIEFRFAATADQFLTIAELRAARPPSTLRRYVSSAPCTLSTLEQSCNTKTRKSTEGMKRASDSPNVSNWLR